jgi:hypothetical protein
LDLLSFKYQFFHLSLFFYHADDSKNVHKLAKDGGYLDDPVYYDAADFFDDYDGYDNGMYTENWHYNDWAWEYNDEWVDDEEAYHESTSSWTYDEDRPYRTGGQAGEPGYTLTRFGPRQGSNITNEDDGTSGSSSASGVLGRSIDGSVNGSGQMSKQTNLPQFDTDGPPMRFKYNFPSVQHRVYSGVILLKASSSFDLSEMDPEIFAVLQTVLTPYLQTEVGSTLEAYTLEVDYSPRKDDVSGGVVVTILSVTCTLKVKSNSIESLRNMNHDFASQLIYDFFAGDYLANFLSALLKNNINVNEIVFEDQEFKSPLANGQQVVAGISGGVESSTSSSSSYSSDGGNAGAMVGVTIAVVVVGLIFFLHYTGRLPSKEEVTALSLSIRDSIRGSRSKDDSEDFLAEIYNTEEGGKKKRERTWSGTFRRFPTGGIRPAAIQKHPASSKQFLADNSSKCSSSEGTFSKELSASLKDLKSMNETSTGFDDYSFSLEGVGRDYAPTSPRTPRHPAASGSLGPFSPGARSFGGRSSVGREGGGDEFSMPDDYDTVHEDQASLYSKWSHSVRHQPPTDNVYKQAPRRVTPSDLAAATESPSNHYHGGVMDEWSLESFDVKSPSARQLYRDFNGSAAGSMSSPGNSSSSPRSKTTLFGLSIPKFT